VVAVVAALAMRKKRPAQPGPDMWGQAPPPQW